MPATGVKPVLIRVKRKRGDVPPEDLVVEGIPTHRDKRAALTQQLRSLGMEEQRAVAEVQPPQQRFKRVRMTSGLADSSTAAPRLVAQAAAHAFGASSGETGSFTVADDEYHQVTSFSGAAPHDELKSSFCIFDVVRGAIEDDSIRDPRSLDARLMTLLPMVQDYLKHQAAQGGQEGAATLMKEEEYVYDLYAAAIAGDDADDHDGIHEGQAHIVKILDPGAELMSDVEADSNADSEDSNAEGFYTHDYPDDEEDASSGSDLSCEAAMRRRAAAAVWSDSD